MPVDFRAIEKTVVAASRLPTKAYQKVACQSLSTLTPEDKIRVLRLFVERDRRRRAEGRSGDWVPHVYVTGAIGPREVLPWSREDVDFILDAIIAETGVLPPTVAVRAVREFTAGASMDASLRRAIERTAHAMWPDDDGEGVAFRDCARALRTLIGAAAKAPKANKPKAPSAPAKKKPAARKPTKKPNAPARTSFAEAVKRHMESACPSYRYVSTGGGSGPLVTYERPAKKGMRHLQEHVVFQKGLHGASWFRVNLFAAITGVGASGPLEHAVLEGAKLGNDVSFQTNAQLETALVDACTGLERGAASAFARIEKHYPALERLFGGLLAHYSRFLATDGAKLASDDFVETEGTNPPKIVAFDAFVRFLAKKKLLSVDRALDLETPLWRFFHNGRPMHASDYRKGDYYDCSKCDAFVSLSRGKLVPRKLTGFGTHHAFVCKRH